MCTSTPKALANTSPGLLQPWDIDEPTTETLKVFGLQKKLFQSAEFGCDLNPGLKQPWARICQRLRRK